MPAKCVPQRICARLGLGRRGEGRARMPLRWNEDLSMLRVRASPLLGYLFGRARHACETRCCADVSEYYGKPEIEIGRPPSRAFGYVYTHLPEHVRESLGSLEREGAIYADCWVEEFDDFRHVRIAFTAKEAQDYARRAYAYELFIRAGQPSLAASVEGIDPDIAAEADSYSLESVDGATIPAPVHCFAAFLGADLELLTCSSPPERTAVLELQGKESVLFTVRRAIDALTPVIRSFNRRERGLTPWPVSREDDCRDLLYAMLRPTLIDLKKEEPTPSFAQTHKFIDLCSNASRLLIEIKWIGRGGQWKRILDQIYTDVQCYPAHPACETLVFVIVDDARDIPDPRHFERELTGRQEVREKAVDVQVYVVEP